MNIMKKRKIEGIEFGIFLCLVGTFVVAHISPVFFATAGNLKSGFYSQEYLITLFSAAPIIGILSGAFADKSDYKRGIDALLFWAATGVVIMLVQYLAMDTWTPVYRPFPDDRAIEFAVRIIGGFVMLIFSIIPYIYNRLCME